MRVTFFISIRITNTKPTPDVPKRYITCNKWYIPKHAKSRWKSHLNQNDMKKQK